MGWDQRWDGIIDQPITIDLDLSEAERKAAFQCLGKF